MLFGMRVTKHIHIYTHTHTRKRRKRKERTNNNIIKCNEKRRRRRKMKTEERYYIRSCNFSDMYEMSVSVLLIGALPLPLSLTRSFCLFCMCFGSSGAFFSLFVCLKRALLVHVQQPQKQRKLAWRNGEDENGVASKSSTWIMCNYEFRRFCGFSSQVHLNKSPHACNKWQNSKAQQMCRLKVRWPQGLSA